MLLTDSLIEHSQDLVPTFKNFAVRGERLPPRQPHPIIEKLLAKLTSARSELEDALRLASMLSEPIRNKLASVIVDVQDLLHEIE